MWVPINDELIAVQIYGDSDSHTDALLIHGFTGSKEDFEEVAARLAGEGFRILTFDNRGQNESGHSEKVDGYSMESLGRDVIELSNYFKFRRPHILGHSFGGLIAQQAVLLNPKAWSSLTLLCSGPGGRKSWLQEPQFEGLTNETKAEIWERVLEKDRLAHPRLDLLKRRWLDSDAGSTMIYRNHLLNQESLITEISQLKIPTHVIYGENDDAWPITDQNQMANELTAKVTVLEGCGHCPNEDNPELTAQRLAEFWNGL